LLIDDLAIQQSTAVAMHAGTTGTPINTQKDVIERLHTALVSCGWTSSDLFPSGTITYFLGAPSVSGGSGPTHPVGCGSTFVQLGSTKFVLYNPFTETPIAGATCTLVAMGTTPEQTLTNLCSAMSTGPWLASWRARTPTGYYLTVVSIVAGASLNYTTFVADGAWGVAGEISGGGYTFRSVADSRTSQYYVKVTAQGQVNGFTRRSTKPVFFDFKTSFNDYGAAVVELDADGIIPAPGYTIVANPYSFAVFVPTDSAQTAVFAAAPYVPTDFTDAYALCVIYPQLGGHTYWGNGSTTWLDNGPQGFISSQFPRMLAVRSPGGTPLKTPTGAPLITTAWLMYGKDYTQAAAVVGRLWDCAIASDQVNGSVIAGKRYIALASQDGSSGQTRSSLLFRIDN
jgi:hypothetical protein